MISKQNMHKVQSVVPTPSNGALNKAVQDAAKTSGPTMPKNVKAGDEIALEDIFGSLQNFQNN